MNWLYITVAIVLAILLFSGGGNSIAKGTASNQETSYSDFKTYVSKGYAQRVVINKTENTLQMYIKPQYIQILALYLRHQTTKNIRFPIVIRINKAKVSATCCSNTSISRCTQSSIFMMNSSNPLILSPSHPFFAHFR